MHIPGTQSTVSVKSDRSGPSWNSSRVKVFTAWAYWRTYRSCCVGGGLKTRAFWSMNGGGGMPMAKPSSAPWKAPSAIFICGAISSPSSNSAASSIAISSAMAPAPPTMAIAGSAAISRSATAANPSTSAPSIANASGIAPARNATTSPRAIIIGIITGRPASCTARRASLRFFSASASSSASVCHALPRSPLPRKSVAFMYANLRQPCVPSRRPRAFSCGTSAPSEPAAASSSSDRKYARASSRSHTSPSRKAWVGRKGGCSRARLRAKVLMSVTLAPSTASAGSVSPVRVSTTVAVTSRRTRPAGS
mmetsp:Transcript_41287/g.129325  ORF Transcript_41287/g.129325 Transcript_41287/m.129325 type:complete len:308 (+) Transcript_41287:2782-3705(+)